MANGSCIIDYAGAKVIFPGAESTSDHNGQIIECSWDAKQEAWIYMRERRDKKTPNAWHVYEKVLQSIKDNITPSSLVKIIEKATADNAVYPSEPKAAFNASLASKTALVKQQK